MKFDFGLSKTTPSLQRQWIHILWP